MITTNSALRTILFLMLGLSSMAQDSTGTLYLRVNAGYAFPLAEQEIEGFSSSSQKATGNADYTQMSISLGKGLSVSMAGGYMFNDNLGAEIDFHYLFGARFKTKNTYEYEYQGNTYTSSVEDELSATLFTVAPAFVVSLNLEKICFFARTGPLIGSGRIVSASVSEDPLFGTVIERWVYDKGFAYGMNASLGVKYKLKGNWSLAAEMSGRAISWAPLVGTMTALTVNGTDEMPNLTTRQKNINFVKTYSANNFPSDLPEERLQRHYPFSSVGLNAGLIFSF